MKLLNSFSSNVLRISGELFGYEHCGDTKIMRNIHNPMLSWNRGSDPNLWSSRGLMDPDNLPKFFNSTRP